MLYYERLRELNIELSAQNRNCHIGGHGWHDAGDFVYRELSRGTRVGVIMPTYETVSPWTAFKEILILAITTLQRPSIKS